MGKIKIEIESEYDVGDVVIFEKAKLLIVGIIEGFYCDHDAGNSIWYNVRIDKDFVYTYSNGGDIGEGDIICRLNGHDSNAEPTYIMELRNKILGKD